MSDTPLGQFNDKLKQRNKSDIYVSPPRGPKGRFQSLLAPQAKKRLEDYKNFWDPHQIIAFLRKNQVDLNTLIDKHNQLVGVESMQARQSDNNQKRATATQDRQLALVTREVSLLENTHNILSEDHPLLKDALKYTKVSSETLNKILDQLERGDSPFDPSHGPGGRFIPRDMHERINGPGASSGGGGLPWKELAELWAGEKILKGFKNIRRIGSGRPSVSNAGEALEGEILPPEKPVQARPKPAGLLESPPIEGEPNPIRESGPGFWGNLGGMLGGLSKKAAGPLSLLPMMMSIWKDMAGRDIHYRLPKQEENAKMPTVTVTAPKPKTEESPMSTIEKKLMSLLGFSGPQAVDSSTPGSIMPPTASDAQMSSVRGHVYAGPTTLSRAPNGTSEQPGTSVGTASRVPMASAPGTNVFATDIPAEGKALLDTIATGESHGDYSIRQGGGHISDFSQHPGTIGPGGISSATGKYQFIKSTWDEASRALGLTDFSPESQDKAAWWLAQRDYNKKTGRKLVEDLKDPKMLPQITTALNHTWTSLTGGGDATQQGGRKFAEVQKNFNNNLDKYNKEDKAPKPPMDKKPQSGDVLAKSTDEVNTRKEDRNDKPPVVIQNNHPVQQAKTERQKGPIANVRDDSPTFLRAMLDDLKTA